MLGFNISISAKSNYNTCMASFNLNINDKQSKDLQNHTSNQIVDNME